MQGAVERRKKRVRPNEPVTPANNKYLAKRWDQDIFNEHRKKVDAAKAMIDNKSPIVYMHLHIKLKKLQFEAERLATIERDNRILLEKMAHIMRTGGLVDHKKHDYEHKSLNQNKRRRELLRITYENQAILKRLTSKDPHYNHKKWLHEWQVNQHYLINVSKYPHPWRPEQSVYVSMGRRQAKANKKINDKVKTNSLGPVAHQSTNETTPIPAPSSPSDIKIKIESPEAVESTQPEMSREPDTYAFEFPEIKNELDLVSSSIRGIVDGEVMVKPEEEVDSIPITISHSDYEQVVNIYLPIADDEVMVKPEEEDEVNPIPITISQSDYEQVVNIDLPIVDDEVMVKPEEEEENMDIIPKTIS